MHHKFVVLKAQLAELARFFEQAFERLAHVTLQVVLGEVKGLQIG